MGVVGSTELDSLDTGNEHGTFPQQAASPPAPAPNPVINARGNTTVFAFDGVSRLLRKTRHLRQDGTGGSIVVGEITTLLSWDGNSRLRTRVDPNGNGVVVLGHGLAAEAVLVPRTTSTRSRGS